MDENNVLYSDSSERREDSNFSPDNQNHKKNNSEKEYFYLLQEKKEIKENHYKLLNKLEELEQKLKEKNIDVILFFQNRQRSKSIKKLYMKKIKK